jgi:hypothetical protein
MVGNGKKTVSVWGKVDSDNVGTLVGNDIEETWILMGETIVILSPDGSGKKDIEGGNLCTPRNLVTFFDPLTMLVDHGVDDVDEGLVGVEETVATREKVTFQPTFASVLGKYFHDTTSHHKISTILIFLEVLSHPDLLSGLVDLAKLVGLSLIRTEDTEVGQILGDDVAEEDGHVAHAGHGGDTGLDTSQSVFAEVGHVERFAEKTTVTDGVGRHTLGSLGSEFSQLRNELTLRSENFFGLVASHPVLEKLEMGWVGGNIGDWDLMRSPETLRELTAVGSWSSPSLGGTENNHGPAWAESDSRVTGLLLVSPDLQHTFLEGGSHGLVHGVNVGTLNEVWLPSVTDEEGSELLVGDTSKNSGVVDLVTVEVENWEDGTITNWVEPFGAVP